MDLGMPHIRLWLLTSLALIALAAGVWANLVFWPVTYLGYTTDLVTGQVTDIDAESTAARAGLRVGDQIVQIYGLPYDAVLAYWNQVALLAPDNGPVPMVVDRQSRTVAFQIARDPPPPAYQMIKLVTALLALMCWLTGWLLGLVRRHEATASSTVAAFWITLGGALGVYQFARFASFPLLAIVQWLFLAMLTPLGVYVHLRFPARPVAGWVVQIARSALGAAWLIGTALFVGALTVGHLTVPEFVVAAARLLPLAFFLSFVGSAAVLYQAYRQAQITHLRRQIRLITAACLFVGGVWLFLLVGPVLTNNLPPLAGAWSDLLAGLVPLAYLVSGVLPNLYHLDRLVRRGGALLTTLVLMALLLAGAVALLPPGVAIIGLVGICALAYRPLASLVGRLFADRDRAYAPLHIAAHDLTTSLDPQLLAAACLGGLRATFHDPRCGLYLADRDQPGCFRRVLQVDAPDLPEVIGPGPLLHALAAQPRVCEARELHGQLQTADLRDEELALLHARDIALFGGLRQAQEPLRGFVVLGTDRRLDPYYATDLREIQRLLDAAALAFTNSAIYQQQCAAEVTIRDLYHALQRVQDETSAAFSRELHDEIINVNVRLNIQSLRALLRQIADPQLRSELEMVLAGEENIAEGLRVICERLHPSGLDDPLGLPNLLRLQVERAETMWPGACELVVRGEPVPLARRQQHEALRIVREGVTNAVKHANATLIQVTLCYPKRAGTPIVITVTDDGCGVGAIQPRPGHRGVRGMIESARTAGGQLSFASRPAGGTCLSFTFQPWPPDSAADALDNLSSAETSHAF